MAYNELIKDFSVLRQYIESFFIYGFRSRTEFTNKSARSYDDARRRIENYLGDLVSFRQDANGKNVFISVDGRSMPHNPLYRAFKSKSFTDKDITFFFIILDILRCNEALNIREIIQKVDDEYFAKSRSFVDYDESTLRKKIKEYVEVGILQAEKCGRELRYRLAPWELDIEKYREAIRFFTEESPLGIVGSYLEDKLVVARDKNIVTSQLALAKGNDAEEDKIALAQEYLIFRNHYIMNAYDADVLEVLLQGIHEHRYVEFSSISKRSGKHNVWKVMPFRIYASSQGGRSYLMGMVGDRFKSQRIDYIQKVKLLEQVARYNEYKINFEKMAKHMWGVTNRPHEPRHKVVMDIHVEPNEDYIVRRLYRERRHGSVTKLDDETYRFEILVYDAYEMIPWIRSFFGRIKFLYCPSQPVMQSLANDLRVLFGSEEEDNWFYGREGNGL